MATTKKPTARKTTATRAKAPTKKVAAKSTPKKRSSKKTAARQYQYETFKLAKDVPPLMSFKITRQTVYWVIIMAFVIFFQLWIIRLQVEVAQMLHQQQVQSQEETTQ